MSISQELKLEKAVEHVIAFAHYMAHTTLAGAVDTDEVLALAAARTYRAKRFNEKPAEWVANEFAQYMRECVLDGAEVK